MATSLSYVSVGLWLHFLVIGPLLCVMFLKLYRDGQFHWLSAGFWAWGSMALYYFITPMTQHLGNPFYLETRLAATEGLPRMIWITFCVALGISVFFLAYFKTKPGRPRFGLPQDSWPPGTWLVLILTLAGAAYSLIKYRGAFGFQAEDWMMEGGQYVGSVTGYATAMHVFAAFPIILFILRRSTRILGYGLLGIYLVSRMGDVWDRASAVSLVLAVTMVATAVRARKWPPRFWMTLFLAYTLLMLVRGHVTFTEFHKSGGFTAESIQDPLKRGESTSQLASLYLKSYVDDRVGYNYGIPMISQAMFGWLPRKYFPWKDWLMKQFQGSGIKLKPVEYEMLWGSKASIIGDLYGCGTFIAILIGMAFLGFLTRKLDGWVAPEAPVAARALGYTWLGYYYMLFGSGVIWGVCVLYLSGIPFLGVALCAKLFGRKPEFDKKPEPQTLALGDPSRLGGS